MNELISDYPCDWYALLQFKGFEDAQHPMEEQRPLAPFALAAGGPKQTIVGPSVAD